MKFHVSETTVASNQKQKRSFLELYRESENFLAHDTKNTNYGGLSRVPLHFWNICSSGPIIKRRRAAIETRNRDNTSCTSHNISTFMCRPSHSNMSKTCDNGCHTAATNKKNTTISRTKNGDHNRVQQRFCRQARANGRQRSNAFWESTKLMPNN